MLEISGNNQPDERHLLSCSSTFNYTISLDENETLQGHSCLHAVNDHKSNVLIRKISLQLKPLGFLHLRLIVLL